MGFGNLHTNDFLLVEYDTQVNYGKHSFQNSVVGAFPDFLIRTITL